MSDYQAAKKRRETRTILSSFFSQSSRADVLQITSPADADTVVEPEVTGSCQQLQEQCATTSQSDDVHHCDIPSLAAQPRSIVIVGLPPNDIGLAVGLHLIQEDRARFLQPWRP